jgi:hypothetical protein
MTPIIPNGCLCVRYHRLRTETTSADHAVIGACDLTAVPSSSGTPGATDADTDAAVPAGKTIRSRSPPPRPG